MVVLQAGQYPSAIQPRHYSTISTFLKSSCTFPVALPLDRMPHAAVPRFITARARWLAWLCILDALTAPVSRMLPADQVPTLQWLVELAAHWQWLCAMVGAISLGGAVAGTAPWQHGPRVVGPRGAGTGR